MRSFLAVACCAQCISSAAILSLLRLAADDAYVYVPPGMSLTWCSESQVCAVGDIYIRPCATGDVRLCATGYQVLVHGYDHFCPWTGTTIAGGNMTAFKIFITFLCSLCAFVAIVGISAVSMTALEKSHDSAG